MTQEQFQITTEQREIVKQFLLGKDPVAFLEVKDIPQEVIKNCINEYMSSDLSLTRKNKGRVLYMYYIEKASISKIAETLKYSYQRIKQILMEARDELYPYIPIWYK